MSESAFSHYDKSVLFDGILRNSDVDFGSETNGSEYCDQKFLFHFRSTLLRSSVSRFR